MHLQPTEHLFIYGTLAQKEIQLNLFKRIVPTEADCLLKYRKSQIRLPDIPEGTNYPILHFTDNTKDKIDGYVLKITADELKTADDYEGESYLRKEVVLASGLTAWCYVAH